MADFLDLYGKTSKAVRALAEEAMRRRGLHLGQNLLLAALGDQDGRTPGEIASALNVATPTVVKSATRMAASGLIARNPDGIDRRLVRLWLTSKGRALLKPIEADRCLIEERITAELTVPERKHLISALTKIHRTAHELLTDDSRGKAQDSAKPRLTKEL